MAVVEYYLSNYHLVSMTKTLRNKWINVDKQSFKLNRYIYSLGNIM